MFSKNANPSISGVKKPREFVWVVVFLIGLVFLFLNVFWLIPTIKGLTQSAEARQKETALRISSEIDALLVDQENGLKEAARALAPLRSLLPVDQKNFLSGWLSVNDSVVDLTLIGADGRQEYHLPELPLQGDQLSEFIDRGSDAAFQQALANGFYEKGSCDAIHNSSSPCVTMAVAVKQNGQTTGVLAAKIDLKKMSDLVNLVKIGQRGFIYAAGSGGEIFAHSDSGFSENSERGAALRGLIGKTIFFIPANTKTERVKVNT